MELKQIKDMMAAMTRHGTKRLVIKKKDFELELERECAEHSHEAMIRTIAEPRVADIPQSLAPPVPLHSQQEDTSKVYVTSPMVGTFYTSPAPDEPAFAKVGDKVEEGTVICIIEAMKVMNEVKAGVSGTIAEILVDNGHPVEFGSKLFRIS